MAIRRIAGTGTSDSFEADYSTGSIRPRAVRWLPIFTGFGLLLAILSVFMWGNLLLGIFMVLFAAFAVFLSYYVARRVEHYRWEEEGSPELADVEPRDPITGRPD